MIESTDALATLARYNRLTNRELEGILTGLTEEQLTRPVGGFFQSVVRTANHILLADITWLQRLTGNVKTIASLKGEVPVTDEFGFEAIPWPHLNGYLPVRRLVDDILVRVVEMIPRSQRTEIFAYRRWNGEQRESSVGNVLLHVFNHQTHHRGQIALMLDELGVENDYSNLIWKV